MDSHLTNRMAALRFLQAKGFKVQKSRLYKDVKRGKLRMQSNGRISVAAAIEYGENYLKIDPPDFEGTRALTLEEKHHQVELLKARRRKLDLEHGLLSGRYVERDQVLTEFSVKLGLIDSVFKTGVRTSVAGWLHEIGADPEKGEALFSHFEAEIDRLMGDMANMETIKVVVRRTPEVAN